MSSIEIRERDTRIKRLKAITKRSLLLKQIKRVGIKLVKKDIIDYMKVYQSINFPEILYRIALPAIIALPITYVLYTTKFGGNKPFNARINKIFCMISL